MKISREFCVDSLYTCATVCMQYATGTHPALNTDIPSDLKKLMSECAAICFAMSELMRIESKKVYAMRSLCSEVCKTCAEECLKQEEESFRECIDACLLCYEKCTESLVVAL